MRLPATGRVVLCCPNKHKFEIDMFDPQLLAMQRFVCELCGTNFTVDGPLPTLCTDGVPEALRKTR